MPCSFWARTWRSRAGLAFWAAQRDHLTERRCSRFPIMGRRMPTNRACGGTCWKPIHGLCWRPWRRGGRILPRSSDVQRISSRTPNAYVTAQGSRLVGTPARRDRMVDKTIRDFRIRLRSVSMSSDAVRLRRAVGSQAPWRIELFGSACALKNFAA